MQTRQLAQSKYQSALNDYRAVEAAYESGNATESEWVAADEKVSLARGKLIAEEECNPTAAERKRQSSRRYLRNRGCDL